VRVGGTDTAGILLVDEGGEAREGLSLVGQWNGSGSFFAGWPAFRDSMPGIFICLTEPVSDRGATPHRLESARA